MKFQINKTIFYGAIVCFFLSYGCAEIAGRHALLPVLNNPAGYLKEVLQKSQSINDVSGYAKLKISAPGHTSSSRNIFFVKRPDRIRIETLGFLSRPALFFTANGMTINLYAVENNALYTGETTAENFARIIGMRLELQEIVLSFLGQPPLAACVHQSLSCAQDNDQYLFTIACEGRKQMIWIDPADMRICRYRLFEEGNPVYEYAFSQFQKSEGRLFPLKIEIYHYTYKTAITLDFESLSFDTLSDEQFSIKLPQGSRSFGIEELGAQH